MITPLFRHGPAGRCRQRDLRLCYLPQGVITVWRCQSLLDIASGWRRGSCEEEKEAEETENGEAAEGHTHS